MQAWEAEITRRWPPSPRRGGLDTRTRRQLVRQTAQQAIKGSAILEEEDIEDSPQSLARSLAR